MTVQKTEYSSTGAFCAVHPQRGAVATCDHCGTFACPECIVLDGDRQICRTCVREQRVQLGSNPWERREDLGILPAAWQTVLAVSASPGRFFKSLGRGGTVSEAALFQALVLVPALFMSAIYGQLMLLAFGDMFLDLIEQFASQIPADTMEEVRKGLKPSAAGVVKGVLLNLIIGPPIWILIVMAFGVVQHGFLSVVGGAKRDFETTLRVCLYAGGVRFWEVIPLVNWIGLPWVLTVQSIGLANAHETDGWKGAVGGWGPAFGCCCCLFAGTFALGFVGALAA